MARLCERAGASDRLGAKPVGSGGVDSALEVGAESASKSTGSQIRAPAGATMAATANLIAKTKKPARHAAKRGCERRSWVISGASTLQTG
jgi:hypothetical protein